jgi:hypothetical protein
VDAELVDDDVELVLSFVEAGAQVPASAAGTPRSWKRYPLGQRPSGSAQ